MSQYVRFPTLSGGNGVPTYPTFSSLPASASDGSLALTLDTDVLYVYNLGSLSWIPIAGAGSILSVGTVDSGSPSANGAKIVLNNLIMQSASASMPGLVNTTTQTFAGNKTLSGTTNLSALTASSPLRLDSSKNITTGSTSLTTEVTGVLPIANGGTNNGSLGPVLGGIVYSDASKLNILAAGTSGYVLQSVGASTPAWVTPPSSLSDVTLTPTSSSRNVIQGSTNSLVPLSVKAKNGTPTPVSPITWTNVLNCTTSINTVTKNGGAGAGFNAGADSTQQITTGNNGYVEYTAPGSWVECVVGLNFHSNASHAPSLIDYGIYFASSSQIQYVEFGGVFGVLSSYIPGDVVRVDATNSTVNYYKNGVLLRTAPTAVSFPLWAAVNIQAPGSSVTVTYVNNNSALMTADIQDWEDDSGVVLASVDKIGRLSASSGFSGKRITTAVSYSVNINDYIVGVTSTASARTITLPAANMTIAGQHFIVVDESNACATNNITVSCAGSDTFYDGSTTKIINVNGGALNLYSDGSSKYYLRQIYGVITALTGDGTAAGPGSSALTLATVNANTGAFGSSTAIPSFTVNGKGLITAASTNAVVAPASTLTGTTLASNVVTSSLTAIGTIATGVWHGTAVAPQYGGTGQDFSASTGALSVSSGTVSAGTLSIANGGTNNGSLAVTAGGTLYTDGSKLVNVGAGSSNQILKSNGSSAPTWVASILPPSTNTLKIIAARIANNGTASIASQTGGVASVTRNGTGDVTVTITGGVFSSEPWVIATSEQASAFAYIKAVPTSTTAQVQIFTDTGNPVDGSFQVLIIGQV